MKGGREGGGGHIVSPLPPFLLPSLAALVLSLLLALHMCPPSLLCTCLPSCAPALPPILVCPSSLSFPCACPVGGGAVAAAPTAIIAGAVGVAAAAAAVHACTPSLVPAGPLVCVCLPVEVGSKVVKCTHSLHSHIRLCHTVTKCKNKNKRGGKVRFKTGQMSLTLL